MSDETSLVAWDLAPSQLTAAELIGRGHTREEAAAAVKVDRSTVFRWLHIPQFQEAVAQFNREWRAEFAAKTDRLIERAIELEQCALDDATSPLSAEERTRLAHDILARTQYR